MPGKLHRERVKYGGDSVYRYLLCCKRCMSWKPPTSGFHGTCVITGERRTKNALSCSEFDPSGDGEIAIHLETARLDGKMTRVIVGTAVYYCTDDEVADIHKILDTMIGN